MFMSSPLSLWSEADVQSMKRRQGKKKNEEDESKHHDVILWKTLFLKANTNEKERETERRVRRQSEGHHFHLGFNSKDDLLGEMSDRV